MPKTISRMKKVWTCFKKVTFLTDLYDINPLLTMIVIRYRFVTKFAPRI